MTGACVLSRLSLPTHSFTLSPAPSLTVLPSLTHTGFPSLSRPISLFCLSFTHRNLSLSVYRSRPKLPSPPLTRSHPRFYPRGPALPPSFPHRRNPPPPPIPLAGVPDLHRLRARGHPEGHGRVWKKGGRGGGGRSGAGGCGPCGRQGAVDSSGESRRGRGRAARGRVTGCGPGVATDGRRQAMQGDGGVRRGKQALAWQGR